MEEGAGLGIDVVMKENYGGPTVPQYWDTLGTCDMCLHDGTVDADVGGAHGAHNRQFPMWVLVITPWPLFAQSEITNHKGHLRQFGICWFLFLYLLAFFLMRNLRFTIHSKGPTPRLLTRHEKHIRLHGGT